MLQILGQAEDDGAWFGRSRMTTTRRWQIPLVAVLAVYLAASARW